MENLSNHWNISAYLQSLVGYCLIEVGWVHFRHVAAPGPLMLAGNFSALVGIKLILTLEPIYWAQ